MSRPLRVLLLCDRLSLSGGVERFVCALANDLAMQGLDVAVGSVDTPRNALRYPLLEAVRVVSGELAVAPVESRAESSTRGIARAWRLLRTQWRTGRALSHLTRRESPDVVVLNALTTSCSTLLLDRRFASRTICCDHNHFAARSRLWQRLRAWLYPQVAAVVSLTEADAAHFRALNPNTHVIYNATALRADTPAAVAAPIALAVGRHVAQKGFDLLLAAWAIVQARLPEARLRIVGEGQLRLEHERLAGSLGLASSVEWIDPTSEIERLYRGAAVFALPSRYEGMPLALLEAQALGVPAVAFDCPTGPAEILTPETGRLVPAGDTGALAEALIALLAASVDERAAMGRAAIARSQALFSPQRHVQRWTALINEVGLRHRYGRGTVPA